MTATPLSCYILTYNSERRIEQVLRSLEGVADEIVLIDSGSKDATLEIGRRFNAKILARPFDNFRDQRIFGEDSCTHQWVLALDSDEVLSEELRARLLQLKQDNFAMTGLPAADGFALRRNWFFIDTPVRNFYPVRTPEYVIRLFRHDRIGHRGGVATIHEELQIGSSLIKYLDEPIQHYSCDSIDDLYQKTGLYTRLSAEEMFSHGAQSSWIKIYLFPWLIWFRWHVVYGGWRDGTAGRILGKYVRDTVYLKYLKLKYMRK